MGKQRLPVRHAGRALGVGQRGGVLDDVDVVRVDADAQTVGDLRKGRDIARFQPHRQQRDGVRRVQRLDQQRRVTLAQQAVGEAVDAGLRLALTRYQCAPGGLRLGQLDAQRFGEIGRRAVAQRSVERRLLRRELRVERALLGLQPR
ncbi:hypothetical protein [Sulfuriferula multivorans]|uniref:hypothetical protein n=1 Tax=Sulfuriferula multivorans TaxID=1559896 RepID=UPI000F5BA4EF|nr:hypothetical protein [Sulfuriferula multivorans]